MYIVSVVCIFILILLLMLYSQAGAALMQSIKSYEGFYFIRQECGMCDRYHIANGPGKLTQAFCITNMHDGTRKKIMHEEEY